MATAAVATTATTIMVFKIKKKNYPFLESFQYWSDDVNSGYGYNGFGLGGYNTNGYPGYPTGYPGMGYGIKNFRIASFFS